MKYFPTLREIRDELIKAQINELDGAVQNWNSEKTRFRSLKMIYTKRWEMLFNLANLDDLDVPLTRKILSNPEHNITKHLLYLYSMESFIYGELNRATRNKDKSKIKYYGAYSAALSYIIHSANLNRKDDKKLQGEITLYRGLKMKKKDYEDYKEKANNNEPINLTGYTSTSKDIEVAVRFALNDLTEDNLAVIFVLEFKS